MFKQNLTLTLFCIIIVLLQITDAWADDSKNGVLQFFDNHDPKIINGTEASLNATRHQVSIRNRRRDSYFFGTGHICGGSLISENVVLSAAHCFVNYTNYLENSSVTFYPEENFIVVMGNLDRFEYNNNTLVFDIIKIVKRVEMFNLSSFDNDIVLILLNGKVPVEHPSVRPIILNDGSLKNNTICQATGWGYTEDGNPSDILRTVDLPIIDWNDCREKTDYGSFVNVGMICAGYLKGEKDSCKGDSGGPLVCHGLQAGIVSWGFHCAEALRPGVYTDVAFYRNWILEEVANLNATLPKVAGDSKISSIDDNYNNNNNNTSDYKDNGVSSLTCSIFSVGLMLITFYAK